MKKRLAVLMCMVLILISAVPLYADYDGDDTSDVFSVRPDGSLDWFETVSNQYRMVEYVRTTSGDVRSIATGDLDMDGKADLLFSRVDSNQPLTWYEATGVDNQFAVVASPFGTKSISLNIGNFDNDNYGDLFCTDPNRKLSWFESTGDNTVTYRKLMPYSNVRCVVVGDVDHQDGNDILIAADHALVWAESTPDNVYTANYWAWDSLKNINSIAMGDLDKNGNTDFFFIKDDPIWGTGTMYWYEFRDSNNDGYIDSPAYRGRAIGGFVSVTAGDVDRDGRIEVVAVTSDGNIKCFN